MSSINKMTQDFLSPLNVPVTFFDNVESTNSWAKVNFSKNSKLSHVILADFQSKGRGRGERQ